MNDVYLIKKETLTNIADKIRQYGNYVEGVTFTPENMPDEIYDVYIAGRDYGYDIGYDTALNSLPTPLVIQAKATPTYNSNLDEYYFTYTTFNTDEGDFDRFFDWEVLDSESSLSIALTNFTDRYLYVYMYYTLLDGDYESLGFIRGWVPPNSSQTFTKTSPVESGSPLWYWEWRGVRFI